MQTWLTANMMRVSFLRAVFFGKGPTESVGRSEGSGYWLRRHNQPMDQ
jgi:hypothetical protein